MKNYNLLLATSVKNKSYHSEHTEFEVLRFLFLFLVPITRGLWIFNVGVKK